VKISWRRRKENSKVNCSSITCHTNSLSKESEFVEWLISKSSWKITAKRMHTCHGAHEKNEWKAFAGNSAVEIK
jgi:hypothetical protein